MEKVLVSAVTGALKPVLGKLGALLSDEYKRFKGVRGEIDYLIKELISMEAFLLEMSKDEDPSEPDKVWAEAVRDLSYDMDDSINDFMQNIDDKDTKPDGFIEKIKHSLGKLGKMKDRRRIGNEIQNLKKKIVEVGNRNARYNSGVTISSTNNATVDLRSLAIFERASKLVGIDGPKAEITKLLNDGVSIDGQPKMVSIVGTGGMGKTTLANQVYQELKEKFECKAFVSVSRNPNLMNIMRTIHSQVSGLEFADTKAGSVEQVVMNINSYLADKRYFVVVDDIWDVAAWDVIKLAFPMASSDSIIITTTRKNDVAKSCRLHFSGNIYSISPLNVVHSRQLFHRRLFDSEENCPSYLEEVSDQILKKCDGLPLAIIAISGLLANTERTEDQWKKVKDSIGRAVERNPDVDRMMKILSLSYFDLPPHVKTCLLYISMFPEDSYIEKYDLIRRWIGEGFIHKDDRYTAHENGERCFNELVNRGLIRPGDTDEYGKVKSCQVHDMILDFIVTKSTKENFVTVLHLPVSTSEAQSKVIRRLSVQGVKQEKSTISTASLDLSHVRSMSGAFVEMPSLEKFKHLRVLHLEYYDNYHEQNLENIMRLFQLRYLSFRHCRVGELPKQIGRLGCLEILDLRETSLKELPASIVNLGNLSHLLLDYGVTIPDGVAKMEALETLKEVGVSLQSLDFLSGLGQLKNLRNLALDSYTNDTVEAAEERSRAIVSSLCELGTQNLCSLTIQDGSGLLQVHLCELTLEKLVNCSLAIQEIPKWVSSLRNLQKLILEVEGVKQDDICMLGALPALEILHLKQKTESNELRISGEVGFQSLRIFVYDAKYHTVDHMFAAGSMPKLGKLVLICHVAEADSLDFGIENLPCLSTIRCEANGDGDIVEAAKTALERAASTHPKHPSLLFRHVNKYDWSRMPSFD